MKKHLTCLLAITLLVALFSACGGTGSETVTQPPSNTSGDVETQAPVNENEEPGEEEAGPYHLAAGKYETDENGIPLAPYEYQLPLSATDEVFTYWTCPVLVDAVPESGYEDMEYPAALAEKTGVHLEYLMIAWADRATNFSVLVASDDLPDLLTNPNMFYPGTMQEAVDDGFIVNLFDYKDYMPNYYYEANKYPDDVNVLAKIMPYPETIYEFWCMESEYVTRNSIGTRGDWLERLGLSNEEIITMDDLHNLLLLYKTEIGADSPFLLYQSIDPHSMFSAYDTICSATVATVAPPLIENGQVKFANSRPQDLNFLTMINQWWNEGLCEPDWMSAEGNPNVRDLILDGSIGVIGMIPGEANDYSGINNADPDAYWVPLHKPVLTQGQVFHLGDVRTRISIGSWGISMNCENIPLLVSYCDWFYSPGGIFFENYGVEGYTFYYDEDGKPMLTDFLVNNPSGMSWALLQYAMNDVFEGGVVMRSRTYAFPGGEQLAAFHAFWDDENFYRYDGSMEWPTAITFGKEDNSRLADLGSDIKTYISENYLQFVDNSKPLSAWDSYVAGLDQLGWAEALTIYQQAYDAFMERFG